MHENKPARACPRETLVDRAGGSVTLPAPEDATGDAVELSAGSSGVKKAKLKTGESDAEKS